MNHLSTQKPSQIKEDTTPFDHKLLPLLFMLMGMVITLVHCSKPLTHRQVMVTNRPEMKVFKMKADVVREALEKVLEKKKFVLVAKQSNERHLETKWLEDGGYRSRAVADIKPLSQSKTELTLFMYLEEKHLFSDEWDPMDEIGEDTYRILMGDIEMECYRVLYNRT
ncbi:MAG: hypothetical protein LJE88_08390 [Deltaproteobacteria bacterium]|nr:hypothetical protein [Deltaproteobacteria bacterium]